MTEKEKVFADGFRFNRNEKAPDFVVGNLSIKVEEAVQFINNHARDGWVNLSIKYGRSGNPYIELDTFIPNNTEVSSNANATTTEVSDDIPF